MTRALAAVAYNAAIVALAITATWTASLLPIHDPMTAWAACVVVGCFAALAALTYLPCPCHRKDGQ